MDPSSQQCSALGRSLALIVRYWACNMTIIHDRGQNWPGFGYDEPDKNTLRAIAREVDSREFFVWLALLVMFFLAFSALLVIGAGVWVLHVTANPAASAQTSDLFDYVQMCAQVVVCLSVGLPLAILAASLACGRFFSTTDRALPDRSTTLHFIDKLVFQIARIAVLGTIVDLAFLVFLPVDSTVGQRLELVMPILSPAVSALTLAYYAATRLRRASAGAGR